MNRSIAAWCMLLMALAAAPSSSCRKSKAPGGAAGGPAGATGDGGPAGATGGGGPATGDAAAGVAGAATGSGGQGGVAGQDAEGAWTKVESDLCLLESADVARLTPLPFAWKSCGPGCLATAATTLATDVSTYEGVASARVVSDDVVVRIGSSSPTYRMVASRRLSDGAVVAAVRARPVAGGAYCVPLSWAASAPDVFGFGTGGKIRVGFLLGGSLVWSPVLSNVPAQSSVFENDLGWGMGFSDGSLRTMFPPDSGKLVVVDSGSYQSDSAVARGSFVISNPALAGSTDSVLRAWEPGRPSKTIVAQADTDIPVVALSDSFMVWVGTHGPQRTDGAYTAAEVYWTPSPAGKDTVPVMGGVSLPAIGGVRSLQTWGDYVVAVGAAASKKRALFVTRISDGHHWTIAARPGTAYQKVLAVTPQAILFGEIDDSADPALGQQLQRLVRYDLARLDDLVAAW